MTGQGELMTPKLRRQKFVPLLKGAGLTEIMPRSYNLLKSQ